MNEATTTGAPKRPTFLTVLCILSFVAAGFSIIGGLVMGAGSAMVNSDAVQDAMASDPNAAANMEQASAAMAEAGLSTGAIWLGVALTLIGLIGVIMMWKLKKTGFYVYTGAQVLGIVSPMFMGGSISFGFMTIVSVLFIVLYGLNLKHMS